MSASRLFTLCVSCAMTCASAFASAATARITTNDNRTPAGTLDHGTLALHLEARVGDWHPDGDDDPGVTVKAFAIEGQPLQVPAPLIRVVEGTEIAASIRNHLDEPLVVHGLYSRPAKTGDNDGSVTIAPGEVKEVRFLAGNPGTYFYWAASTPDALVGRRLGKDTQLSGAFIIDPRDGARVPDRVLVITGWNSSTNNIPTDNTVGRIVINSKSWPNTERFTYDVNDTVRLRVLNVGNLVHPMHLHGFYFRVDSRGDERADSIYPPSASPRWANTERLTPGRTFLLTWVPTRTGNWLFHCHDSIHIRRSKPLDGTAIPVPSDHHEVNHALEMMSGPVIGITVRAATRDDAAPAAAARRRLRLVARVDSGGTQTEPAYGFSLEDDEKTTPPAPPYSVGPTIVLKRDEPVSITVENKLPEATSVHWHGIELDSYYDGVPGFAGNPGRIAPAIAPGGSFEARFTPPRSGTFIYHTHVDEVRQQQAGLNGALIVVDSPASYDPRHDVVLLITTPRHIADDNVVLINGTANPPAREFHVGERYRLRLINVHVSRPNIFVRLFRDKALVTWRPIAKDGMDLPPDLAAVGPSEVQIGNGETYDFEFQPTTVGDNLIEVRGAGGALLTSMAILVL